MAAASSLALGGHTYLPYPQAACREIEHHLHALAAAFPCFDATLSPFTHDDGRDVVLVNAAGALPGAGAELSVWLVEAYPHAPPLVFMSLTRPATERPAYVDSSGVVTAPYLKHWRWPDSDLVGLVQSLQVLFRLHPPTVPRGPTGHANEVIADDSAYQDVGHLEADTECVASTVRHRSQDIQMTLRALPKDKDRLQQKLQRVTVNFDRLERTLATDVGIVEHSNGEAMRPIGSDDVTEDAMDTLDRELHAGRLSLCGYLKEIKDVARAQFMNWPVPADLSADHS